MSTVSRNRARNPGLEWRRLFRRRFMHLKRHFDLSRALQVLVSSAFLNLKPLVVFIHDNLFLYSRHITQVCFPSIQRDSCPPAVWWHLRSGWAAVREWVQWVHALELKYELMDATLHIKTGFLLHQHFSQQAPSLFLFLVFVSLTGHTRTHTQC